MSEFKFPDEREKEQNEQEIEFELETDEAETEPDVELEKDNEPEDSGDVEDDIEIVDDTPEEDRNRKPLDKNIEDPTEEELNDYSSKVQKRIKELTRARHDDRRRADELARKQVELERVAKMMAEENNRLKNYVSVGENAFIDKSKSLAQISLDQAKAKLKNALEAGDTEATVQAQEDLYKAQYELQKANSYKPSAPPQPQQNIPQQTQAAPQSPAIDNKVVGWAQRNTWFEGNGEKEREMTDYAYAVHNRLVRDYGEEYTRTDEYFNNIDQAMRNKYPEEFGIEPKQSTEKASSKASRKSVVAPSQRATGAKKLRLTKNQQAICKQYGIPYEKYAREVLKLEQDNG